MITLPTPSESILSSIHRNPTSPIDWVTSTMQSSAPLITALGIVSLLIVCSISTTQAGEAVSADAEMQAGKALFQKGSSAQAALRWTEAARLYEKDGKVKEQTQALINLAQALQQEGQIKKAAITLDVALKLAAQTGDRPHEAAIMGRLGNAAFALGRGDQALEYLDKGLAIARDEQKLRLVAVLLNDKGNVLAAQNRTPEAIDAYIESYDLAQQTGMNALAVTALVNRSNTFIQEGRYAEAQRPLDVARILMQNLDSSRDKVSALLNIGVAYDDVHTRVTPPRLLVEGEKEFVMASRGVQVRPGQSPKSVASEQELTLAAEKSAANLALQASGEQARGEVPNPTSNLILTLGEGSLLTHATDSFYEAARIAGQLGDARSESYAWGYLGQLMEKERRYDEALTLTRKAIFAAQKTQAPESLYRWHWQTARILRAQRKEEDALAAYKRAMVILQPIRYEFSIGYQSRLHSFRDSIRPLFMEYADVLLRRAALTETADPRQSQDYLIQVRDSTEAFKAAELQDYFRDECVKTARANRRTVDSISKTTAIVYTIILPDRLELLVSMDGELRRYGVPIDEQTLTQEVRAFRRALQDRRAQNFLTHAQTLYGWIIRPLERDLNPLRIDTLVFVPDGALRTIPMAALHDGTRHLINQYALAIVPSMELTDPRPIDRGSISLLSMGLTESVQGFPALPNVKAEMDTLNSLYRGRSLLNDQFNVRAMEQEMKEQRFGIVHIASHGLVENDVNDSFLLAYDDKITMDRLSKLIGLFQYRKTPLELLTLSACETAVGDDRAALGLAGVAIKAGARSALATLWFIDDEATAALVAEFYRQLQDPSISKAVALQRAQLKILNEPGREHPSFWAPFLLINNWL